MQSEGFGSENSKDEGEKSWLESNFFKLLSISLVSFFVVFTFSTYIGYQQQFLAKSGPKTAIRAFVMLEDGGLVPFTTDKLSSGVGLVFKIESQKEEPMTLFSQVDGGTIQREWTGISDPLRSGQVVSIQGSPLLYRFSENWMALKLCLLPDPATRGEPEDLFVLDQKAEEGMHLICFQYQRQNLRNVLP